MSEFDQEIVVLREAGASQFDPVAFHYLEVLTRRANEHEGTVRRILDGKLVNAVAAFQMRFEKAQSGAVKPAPAQVSNVRPAHGPLGLLAREFEPRESKELGIEIARHSAGTAAEGPSGRAMTSVGYFRAAWSRLSTNRQVAKAINEAPKNPGPINSHGLVLRSLAVMRDISPDYLNRFVNYTDTLLSLDQSSPQRPAAGRQVVGASTPKKPAPRRAPSRKPSGPGN